MTEQPRRPQPLLDTLGKLCTEGKEAADYLWQVPKDEAMRQKILDLLEQIAVERQTGPQGDAADLRGAEDGRPGEREPAAGGHPRQRLRPPGAPVAGGQVGAAVTGRMREAPAPPARHTDLEQRCINTVRALPLD